MICVLGARASVFEVPFFFIAKLLQCRWDMKHRTQHRPTCLVPGHDAVLSGRLLPTLNKPTASIFMADDKDEVFVQIFCSYPQIQAALSTRDTCFVVNPLRDSNHVLCRTANPPPPHTHTMFTPCHVQQHQATLCLDNTQHSCVREVAALWWRRTQPAVHGLKLTYLHVFIHYTPP